MSTASATRRQPAISPERSRTRLWANAAWIWWASLAALFVWLFADVLFAANGFVYRDAAHFYHPLFKFIAAEWSAGRVPLWNPYENLGTPVVAQGTSSVFYPGKLIFLLPVGFDTAFTGYVLAHVLLAAVLAYRLARRWGGSAEAAALCGLSYAFGGNVIFQYCNVVFLVGAAWLPLAVGQLDRLMRERRLSLTLPLGVVLALMVLGGDPQMAYHVALLGGLYALLLWQNNTSPTRKRGSGGESPLLARRASARVSLSRRLGIWVRTSRLMLLAIACAVAGLLAAVQIVPSWELNSRSERAMRDVPRNIYEAASDVVSRNAPAHTASSHWNALLGKFGGANDYAAQAYDFSVGPWRLAEYVWPNVAGHEFPTNRRWTSALPAEGRIWAPSFYMGLLPLVLALAAWSLRGGDVRTRWLSWIVLLSVLGSFGVFGLGRVVRELAVHWNPELVDPQNAVVGDPFGGVYWLLTVLLPGYAHFRYPAKLLVLAALGLSLLAARGWDDAVANSARGQKANRLLLLLIGLSAVGVVATLAAGPRWKTWLSTAPPSPLFGPLDAGGAWWDVLWAFGQVFVLGAIACWLVRGAIRTPSISTPDAGSSRGARHWAWACVVLTAIDLGIANRWLIATAPTETWQAPSVVAEAIRAREAGSDQPYRVDRAGESWLPREWGRTSSANRQVEGLVWDRHTLRPRYALSESLEMLQASDTSGVFDYQVFLDSIQRMRSRRQGSASDVDQHPRGLDALGTKYFVLPRGTSPPRTGEWKPLLATVTASLPDVRVWENAAALPRAWIVRHVDVLPALHSRGPGKIVERTFDVLLPNGEPRDFRASAVVETDEIEVLPSNRAAASSRGAGDVLLGRIVNPSYEAGADRCTVLSHEPQRVRVDVETSQPGLLVLSDLYYPGWTAELATDDQPPQAVPILRTNRIMRGVALPAGKHVVTFSYRPTSLWASAISSGLAWLALLVWIAVGWRRRAEAMPNGRGSPSS
jgi:hypothetical protein